MPPSYDSDLARKLNISSGMRVRVVAPPAGAALDGLRITGDGTADAVLVFVTRAADVESHASTVVAAAEAGKVAWMAYPKARQLGTDLNRDILWKLMQGRGVEGVRQVAIDETWSGMRFKARG